MNANITHQPYRLYNSIQHYAWGKRGKASIIPNLLGIEAEADKPYAELWMGDHPRAPSKIKVDDAWVTLPQYIASDPELVLGREAALRFGKRLPFLFKVLSAGEVLSIQAHPNKKQAERLHKNDPEHYPDNNHKPEIAVALDHLTALVGFRPLPQLAQIGKRYPSIARFTGEERFHNLERSTGKKEGRRALKDLYSAMLRRAGDDPAALGEALSQLQRQLQTKDRREEDETLFLKLQQQYPNDVGLFSVFLLNLIHLEAGQGIYLSAGIPHAYVEGNIIECMANSDNVVRAGLTPKFKDFDTLSEMLTYAFGRPETIAQADSSGNIVYQAPVEEFQVIRHVVAAENVLEVETKDCVQIALVLEGTFELQWSGRMTPAKRGHSFIIPAAAERIHWHCIHAGTLFVATLPSS